MITALAAAFILQTAPNTLTPQEVKAGWTLLFDGKSTNGWHNFKEKGVKPGWVVKDGVLSIEDPEHAGDIVTNDKFDWFELQVDVLIPKGQNSGIIFHAADDGDAVWHSGPEIQIYDGGPGEQCTGFLYEIYDHQPSAAKPSGEWNHLRIIVAPKKCETYVNGVKYYEYVLGSDDFNARVAKSKFANMPKFAKVPKGTISLQGDHGKVSFRNIKIKTLK